MRDAKTSLVILLVGILMALPLGFPKAESLDSLLKQGYRVMSDEEFMAWYCKEHPDDTLCVKVRPNAKLAVLEVDSDGGGDNGGNNKGNDFHGRGAQGKGHGKDTGRGHDPGHSNGQGHDYN